MKLKLSTTLILVVFSFYSIFSYAAEEAPSMAEMWIVKVELKDTQAFIKAFEEHTKYRIAKKDPRKWKVYSPVTGDDFGTYYIRFCCITWKDVDSYTEWSDKNGLNENWAKTAGKYVQHVEHYFSNLDFKNSKWPEKDPGFKYFEVISFSPKSGMSAKIEAQKAEISRAAIAMNWPYSWSWGWRIGGENQLSLVIPYMNYAGMEDPEMSFTQALGKHMKDPEKASKLMQDWSNNFSSTYSSIVRLRKEMSMPDD